MFGFGGNSRDNQSLGYAPSRTSPFKSGAKWLLGSIGEGGLKGALIGAIALPVIAAGAIIAFGAAIPFALPAMLGGITLSSTVQGFVASQALGLAVKGAIAGFGIGGGIGAIKGISGMGDAADRDAEREAFLRTREAQQRANENLLAMSNPSMAPAQQYSNGFVPTPGLPQQAQGMGRE